MTLPNPATMKVSKTISAVVMVGGLLLFGDNVFNLDDLKERPIRNTLVAGAYVYMLQRSKRDLVAYTGFMNDTKLHTPLNFHRYEAVADWNTSRLLGVAAIDFATRAPESHLVATAFTAAIGAYMLYSTYDHQKKAKALPPPAA